jgi:hypothetical protein
MRVPLLPILILGACALGCHGRDDETGPQDPDCHCGDPDGNGTDTGDIPDLWGNWTTSFGNQLYFDDCGIPDLSDTSETWINNAAMHIGGYAPDGFYAYFGSDDDERFQGIVSQYGGVAFSGPHARRDGYTAYVSFGGLAFHDEYRDRDMIEGFCYMGLDLTGDGTIECRARGEFTAYKSG